MLAVWCLLSHAHLTHFTNPNRRSPLARPQYTQNEDHVKAAAGKGIVTLEWDAASATLAERHAFPVAPNPSYIAAHPTLPVLYAVTIKPRSCLVLTRVGAVDAASCD